MLPTEAFSDAVAFLRLFDLRAFAVASSLCSSLAVKTLTNIRWEEFPGLHFRIEKRRIVIQRKINSLNKGCGLNRRQFVAALTFTSDNDMIEFVGAALPNCIIEEVTISMSVGKPLLDAIGRVAASVMIKGALCPPYSMGADESLSLVRKFVKVKVSLLRVFVSDSCQQGRREPVREGRGMARKPLPICSFSRDLK